MTGGLIGFLITLLTLLCDEAPNWWWLLWGFLIGVLFEIFVRLGAGDSVSDTMSAIATLHIDSGSSGSDGGSSCGGCGGD